MGICLTLLFAQSGISDHRVRAGTVAAGVMAAIFPITPIFSIIPHLSPLDDMLANATLNLCNTTRNIGAVLMLGLRF
ncbi:MAG: hypothetical protein ACRC6S_11500 [Shewanella sp.]